MSIEESKQIRIKKELEMPGSSGGRTEPIPDIENGKNNERNRQLSLHSHKSLRFELGKNLEDASDEVGFNFIMISILTKVFKSMRIYEYTYQFILI